jgi:hypothetical protein
LRRSRDAAVTRMRELYAPSRCRIARRCEVASRAARGRRVGVEHELLQPRVVGHDQRDDAEREHPERVTFVSALARTMLGALCPLVRSTRWKGLEANVRIRSPIHASITCWAVHDARVSAVEGDSTVHHVHRRPGSPRRRLACGLAIGSPQQVSARDSARHARRASTRASAAMPRARLVGFMLPTLHPLRKLVAKCGRSSGVGVRRSWFISRRVLSE